MQHQGLTAKQAQTRISKYGPNELPQKPPPSKLAIFITQLKNPLVYVLFAAATITFVLGDYSDTAIIAVAVVINSLLGFIQEARASRALFALKKLIHPTTKVLRDGDIVSLEVEMVVPGDLVILDQGAKIPADGILLEANRFFVTESILTGETKPTQKKEKSEVFMGTVVSAGRAKMLVTTTGEETKMGNIAKGIQTKDEDTPLKSQIKIFSKQLSILVFILTVFVFFVGLLGGRDLEETFTVSVALAVSAIPEGLLIGLTAVLAIGMQRITKRKGLVRRLVSAETLGSVTTICLDKTGTLTKGKMSVVKTIGDQKKLCTQAVLANDLDDPITLATWDWGSVQIKQFRKNAENLRKKYAQLDSIPFSSSSRFYASLHAYDDKNIIYVNGAPEYLLKWSNLKKSERQKILSDINKLTQSGHRVMGMARKKVAKSTETLKEKEIQKGLSWVGLLAFSDPVRKSVKPSLIKTQAAGIKLVVITGDYKDTAIHVLHELGLKLKEENIALGTTLDELNEEQLLKLLKKDGLKLFARTTPEQKVRLVDALKKNGEVVGMMGDGVNDALALKKADIGIVVAEATDVAKETADLVLLDSNFNTIVAAIEEGRGIFDNIRKVILYLMTDAFSEIIAVILSLVFQLPLAVTAAQILWINLVSDGFPNLALTVDPKGDNSMKRKPRSANESVVAGWMRIIIFLLSVTGGIIAFLLFLYYYNAADLKTARSVAFAALGVNSLVYVYSVRMLAEPVWKENPFKNKWLNLAVVGGFTLQFVPYFFSWSRNYFEIVTLNLTQILIVLGASFAMLVFVELLKPLLVTKPEMSLQEKKSL